MCNLSFLFVWHTVYRPLSVCRKAQHVFLSFTFVFLKPFINMIYTIVSTRYFVTFNPFPTATLVFFLKFDIKILEYVIEVIFQ